jgi:hypothetical protein
MPRVVGLMLTVLGGLAEFERDLIRERTGEGRKRAQARGIHIGRPPKLMKHQRREALTALADPPRLSNELSPVNAAGKLHRFPEQKCINDADENGLEHGRFSWSSGLVWIVLGLIGVVAA